MKEKQEEMIRNKIFLEVEIQNLLTDLEEKQLPQYNHVKRMARARILIMGLEL